MAAAEPSTSKIIRVVAALIVGEPQGRVLLVRKRGTRAFMQPGGKREPDESDLDALARELREELGCKFAPSAAVFEGLFTAESANEPGHAVEAALYRIRLLQGVRPRAEIEEIVWVDPRNAGDLELAPLTRQFVLPLAQAA